MKPATGTSGKNDAAAFLVGWCRHRDTYNMTTVQKGLRTENRVAMEKTGADARPR